ncbi:MAG: aa3-type cytochrome c oxidase subunit IV [Pseudomonadota bacterium]
MGTSDNHGDMRAHQETYAHVMGLLKWGTVASAIVAAIIIFLIAG